jgi:hypothetical protein
MAFPLPVDLVPLPGRVYLVQHSTDVSVLIALDVKYNSDWVGWFDTTRERVMRLKAPMTIAEERISFERLDGAGGIYTLLPLTLELYRTYVRHRLAAGKDFTSEADLLATFEQTR